ncbi:ketoacyl-synt-domain-containing protein [Penicillium odoratum]|uniref:ketoacyl-synt-domain-containing protein n=1 Tax=Penicillium odoratum TaxID=1167516 RepID=UPI00254968FE|nr:ketoacyl-synt-domain-containing protein [Penicillium odoratum]KAJ5768708.1 ketoacyl-synt-domain-containing protein [Penicillium odoratum]
MLVAAAATVGPYRSGKWIQLAVHIVCIAFRIGVHTARVGERLTNIDESWCRTVHGNIDPELLSKFHEVEILKKLFASAVFESAGLKSSSIPIFAPYHAAHLHQEADINWIIGIDDLPTSRVLGEYITKSPLLSTRNGKPFVATNMADLLGQVIHEILEEVLRWDLLVDEIVSLIPAQSKVSINAIDAPGLAKSLVFALTANGTCDVSLGTTFHEPNNGVPLSQEQPTAHCSKIAVVGMSGRFPEAKNVDELWKVLLQGLDAHKVIPKDRFDIDTHFDPSGKKKNTTVTPYGCFIEEPGLFDPNFFQMSPREATITDPMQRLALVTAYEALEMSGHVPDRTPSSMLDRAGTFYGQTIDDYREVNAAQNIDPFYVTGGLRPFGPFTGPSYSVDTACSSGLASIHIACNSLRSGECDMAIAGGTNIISGSDMYAGLSRGQFLSKSGSCKTFDDAADGYCRADAVGTVVLKRLEDAEADNDPILGVILASATNHSSHAVSITQPHGPTQELLYRKVLSQARVHPSDVDYIEMHGTGTQIGDSTEMSSVSTVFAGRAQEEPLYVGSVKANIGHSEAAAGVTAVIKGLLMFQQSVIPRHVGLKGQLNRKFPSLIDRNIHIPYQSVPFHEKKNRRRRILVNNFGAAGGNTALLMEEPSAKQQAKPSQDRSSYVVAVSGKSLTSLRRNKNRLSAFLYQNEQVSLADLSYTTTSRRMHYRHRFIAVISSIQEIQPALLESNEISTPVAPSLIFAFTGQGSIYCGAAKELFHTSRQFHSDIVEFDNLARSHGLSSFLALLDPTVELASLSAVQTQIGQVCIQMALYRLYRSWGIAPRAVIGHSLGEYAALYASGVFTASDTILVVGRRAELMEQHCTPGTHVMLAVRASFRTVQDLIHDTLAEVACINGPSDVVVGGPVDEIERLASELSKVGVKSISLPVPFACHSAQLDPILDPFEAAAQGLVYSEPNITLLSPLIGRDIDKASLIDAHYLSRHLRERVNFVAALKNSSLLSRELNMQFVELGPHPLCADMVRNTLGLTVVNSLRRGDDSWKTIANSLAALYMRGVDIEWGQYNRDFHSSSSPICLSTLPSYAFDEKNYWIEYQNDWALTKGDKFTQSAELPTGPGTISVQHLLRENLDESSAMAEFESDLMHPALHDVIVGHVINNVGLCPSGVFADMAFTAAKYLYDKTTIEFDHLSMDIVDMEILSPVILELSGERSPRLMRISATITQDKVCIEFSDSMTADAPSTLYAKCTVIRHDTTKVNRKWKRSKHFVSSRIAYLQSTKDVHRLHCRMAYKIFGAVVDYSERFHGMEEILMNSEHYEAVAKVSFKADTSVGNFFRNPYWIDNVTQLSGFVMNANETVDSSKAVYISSGWESMHFAAQLSSQQVYTVYVKMEPNEGSAVSGDMYILDNQHEMIGVVKGVRFQAVPRPLLKLLLAPPKGAISSATSPHQPWKDETLDYSPSTSSTNGTTTSTTRSKNSTVNSPVAAGLTKVPPPSEIVLRVLCEEMDVHIEDLDDNITFSEMGVDSLMSLAVIGHLRESFSLDIPSTFFQHNHTIKHLVKSLDELNKEIIFEGNQKSLATPEKVLDRPSHNGTIHPPSATSTAQHHATSIILQGNLKTATNKLFLFPGGFGTSATFTNMPSIHPELAIFGLNSPFVNAPENFTVSIAEMAALYVTEIQRRQPQGPYSFLGYSVGGIIAYEASRQLLVAGETVERLYLVDSPCPLVIPPMPPNLIKFLDSIDRFSGKAKSSEHAPAEPVKPMGSLHVTQTLISLEAYMPEALPPGICPPRTTYYVAKNGVNNQSDVQLPDISDRDRRVMTWLLEDRTGMGGLGDGWEMLVGGELLKVYPVEGNHFSIMKEPDVSPLSITIYTVALVALTDALLQILGWVDELRTAYWM